MFLHIFRFLSNEKTMSIMNDMQLVIVWILAELFLSLSSYEYIVYMKMINYTSRPEFRILAISYGIQIIV